MENTVKIILAEGACLPSYMTAGSSGADLHALLPEAFLLRAGSYAAIPTGVSVEIPNGYEGQIRPRSGLARKFGITILNAPGTIDSDYRGEIVVLLINHGTQDYTIQNGDRIAQLVICPVEQVQFSIENSLSATQRDKQGFGHTGK